MSVKSEILRIQRNISSAYTKVAEKGGEVPLQPNSQNLAAAVLSIPQTLPPPDNNPIGTILSFLGLTAPDGYLICDGTEYKISEYPDLAAFFQAQFGAKNHFGGDGTDTFAVPDLRNLFLRGYHGESEKSLSGEIGETQEATRHPYVYGPSQGGRGAIAYGNAVENATNFPQNADDLTSSNQHAQFTTSVDVPHWYDRTGVSGESGKVFNDYASRPVNMAVLYCIKAVESASGGNSAGEVYSTEETRIGTWTDGKPLYRRVIRVTIPGAGNQMIPFPDEFTFSEIIHYYGTARTLDRYYALQTPSPTDQYLLQVDFRRNGLQTYTGDGIFNGAELVIIVEYTKTAG